jgi:hypothetical protein
MTTSKRIPKPRKHSHATHPPTPKPQQPTEEALAIRAFRALMHDIIDWYAIPGAGMDFDALTARHPTFDRDRLGALLIAADHVFLEIMRHHAPPIAGARRPIPGGDQR